MRWFKHFSDARRNPKLRLIEKKLGEAGYARWFKLLELVAERGGTGEYFQPRIQLKTLHTDLDWLADEWGISCDEAQRTLDTFVSAGLISPKSWRKKVVEIPQMIEYRDEWTRKRQLRSNSGDAPELPRRDSPQSQSQSQSQNKKQKQSQPHD